MTKLFVIPGHGAGDPGAGCNGYDEAERVRALAKRIKALGGDNVILADFSRNYYADNGISNLSMSTDIPIVELHMDSGPSSAHGGHVIIQAGIGGADDWDRNLEKMISSIFPGRASTLVERDDLANPWRAYQRGYNYRLVENGFISNSGDVGKFNSRMDEIAAGYLKAFGIKVNDDPSPAPTPAPAPTPSGNAVCYRVSLDPNGNDWLPEMRDDHDTGGSSDDYAGIMGTPIRWIAIKGCMYRVHTETSGWLPWVSEYDVDDLEYGCAGDGSRINAIEIDDLSIRYAVHIRGGSWYLDMIGQYDTGGSDDKYAGDCRNAIDAVRIRRN